MTSKQLRGAFVSWRLTIENAIHTGEWHGVKKETANALSFAALISTPEAVDRVKECFDFSVIGRMIGETKG